MLNAVILICLWLKAEELSDRVGCEIGLVGSFRDSQTRLLECFEVCKSAPAGKLKTKHRYGVTKKIKSAFNH